MANRKGYGRLANRALSRIEEKASERAVAIAQAVVNNIRTNPKTPFDEKRAKDGHTGPHLRDSYYVRVDPDTGDALIKCRRRYWAFVEFGTSRSAAKPHVRPAIDEVRAGLK